MGSILRRLGRFPHFAELSIVNTQRNNSYDGKNYVACNPGDFYPPKLSSKFCVYVLFAAGICIEISAHLSLLWSAWSHWRLTRRLSFGLGGWIITIVPICHSVRVLFGHICICTRTSRTSPATLSAPPHVASANSTRRRIGSMRSARTRTRAPSFQMRARLPRPATMA